MFCDGKEHAQCAGTLNAISGVIDWKFAPKWDVYLGCMYTEFNGAIIFPIGPYNPKSPIQFWETARSVRDDLADMRTPGGLSAVFCRFDQLISSKPGVQGIAQFELQVCACDMMVSNLGVLPFEADFGDLRLEALWGPSVFVGIEGEQMIGAATVRGAGGRRL
jgi:hypothetical protein